MDIVHERCAGLDVHKKTVVVCAITPGHKEDFRHRDSPALADDRLADRVRRDARGNGIDR